LITEANDGHIIVLGGRVINTTTAVLNTAVSPMTWSFPVNDNDLPSSLSKGCIDHTATLVGKYMIVAFGLDGKVFLYILTFYIELYLPEKHNISFSTTILIYSVLFLYL